MIKFIYILFFAVLIVSAQNTTLFNDDVIAQSGADTAYTDEIVFSDNFENRGDWLGLYSYILDVDSSISDTLADITGTPDSVVFIQYYRLAGKWYQGDTVRWDRFDATIDNNIISRGIAWINVRTYHDSLLVWVNEPDSTNNIQGLPSNDEVKLRYFTTDTVYFYQRLDVGYQ